jgi:hypothetical protein
MNVTVFDIDNNHVTTLSSDMAGIKQVLTELVVDWLDGRIDGKPDPNKVIFKEQKSPAELKVGYDADDFNDFAPPIYYAKLSKTAGHLPIKWDLQQQFTTEELHWLYLAACTAAVVSRQNNHDLQAEKFSDLAKKCEDLKNAR